MYGYRVADDVTPHDRNPVPRGKFKALYIGGPTSIPGGSGGGDVTILGPPANYRAPEGQAGGTLAGQIDGITAPIGDIGKKITFSNVPSGSVLGVAGTHVLSTGTTATLIKALN